MHNPTKDKITPVHSFDLWGTIVIQDVLGPRVIEAYQSLQRQGETPEEIKGHVSDYEAILRGEKEALKTKTEIVAAVEDPVWNAYARREIDINFDGSLYEDSLEVMAEIAQAGEGLVILTTGSSPWIKQAVTSVNPKVGETISKIYHGNKSLASTYEQVAEDISHKGGVLVSHTEDQLKGFEGILQSDLAKTVNLIYAERNNNASKEQILVQGINQYVHDLREASYLRR